MRSTSHFKCLNQPPDELGGLDDDALVLIKNPIVSPVHEIKNQNRLVNSAMFYFSHEEARDHGFKMDPKVPYSAYFFEEPETNKGRIKFGENRTITFDREEEVSKLVAKEPEKMVGPRNNDIELRPILKKKKKTVVPHDPHPDPYIDACRELMAKCFNMCSIPLEELDINEMFDALGKLIFGISSEFKIKELCYSYVAAAKKRKHFEELEALKAVIESFKDEKAELSERNAELSAKLQQQTTEISGLDQLSEKLEHFESLKEENIGLALVNSDLVSANEELGKKLEKATVDLKTLETVKKENSGLLSKISELSLRNADLAANKSEKDSLNEELLLKNAGLESSNQELISIKDELTAHNAELTATISDFKNKLEDRNAKIKYLESQALNIKAKYDRDTNADMKYFKNKINDLINENVNLTSDVEKIKVNLRHAEDKIDSLLKENASLRLCNDGVRVDLEQKLKDNSYLQSQLKESRDIFEKYNGLAAEKDACEQVLGSLVDEHKALKDQIKDVRNSNEQLLKQNEDLKKYKEAANEALYEVNDEVDRLDRLILCLKQEKNSCNNQIHDLNFQLGDSAKKIEVYKKTILEFKLASQELENKLDGLRKKHERLQNKYRIQEEDIQQARTSMRQMANTLYNTRKSLKNFNTAEQENNDITIVEKYPEEDFAPSVGKSHCRKRDMLRSLANRKSLLVTEPSQNFNKIVY